VIDVQPARAIALRLQYDAQWAINTRANHYNCNAGWPRERGVPRAISSAEIRGAESRERDPRGSRKVRPRASSGVLALGNPSLFPDAASMHLRKNREGGSMSLFTRESKNVQGRLIGKTPGLLRSRINQRDPGGIRYKKRRTERAQRTKSSSCFA